MRADRLDYLYPLNAEDILELQTKKEPAKELRRVIQKRIATVRRSWSKQERRARCCFNGRVAWNVPHYNSSMLRLCCSDEQKDNDWQNRLDTTTIYSLQPAYPIKEKNPVKNGNRQ